MAFADMLVTVTGRYFLLDGSPGAGAVVFVGGGVLNLPESNEVVFPAAVTAPLDADGAFSVQLAPGTYTVAEAIVGSSASRARTVTIPAGASFDLADAA